MSNICADQTFRPTKIKLGGKIAHYLVHISKVLLDNSFLDTIFICETSSMSVGSVQFSLILEVNYVFTPMCYPYTYLYAACKTTIEQSMQDNTFDKF